MLVECDVTNDGSLSWCEIEECIIRVEDDWRAEYCPFYPTVAE
jgi:hypothetical protein